MEFGTNFTQSHFFGKFFTPKFKVNYNIFYFYFTLISFFTHLYTRISPFVLDLTMKYVQKELKNCKSKMIYNKQRMFRAPSYPKEVKFYTDNVRASVTNSMSDVY